MEPDRGEGNGLDCLCVIQCITPVMEGELHNDVAALIEGCSIPLGAELFRHTPLWPAAGAAHPASRVISYFIGITAAPCVFRPIRAGIIVCYSQDSPENINLHYFSKLEHVWRNSQ